jgi:hypothetical protein
MSVGKVYPRDSLFLKSVVGEATTQGELEYKLFSLVNGAMIVESCATGKHYVFSWPDAIKLARDAGVDEPDGAEGESDE